MRIDRELSRRINQKDLLAILEKLNKEEFSETEKVRCPCCGVMLLHDNTDANATTTALMSIPNEKLLKKCELIRDDCSLTTRGKLVLYSLMLGVPINTLKILTSLYVHRKLQKSGCIIPVHLETYLCLFVCDRSDHGLRNSTRNLIESNLAEKTSKHYIMITDSAFSMLSKYDEDISEIESRL